MGDRTYKVSGPDDTLNRLDRFMLAAAKLGDWGASRMIQMSIDGDGHERLSVKGTSSKLDKNSLKKEVDKDTVNVNALKAEELIDLYLEQKDKKEKDPQATRFVKQLDKGQPVKPDDVKDIPFRDTSYYDPVPMTWRSSSSPPYR